MRRVLSALLGLAILLAGDEARAQGPAPARAWSFSASAYAFLLPDEPDYAQPTFTADRDRLHLEARYNYEDKETGSVWAGWNLSFGDAVSFDFTPMIGGVFGETSGVAPGYKLALGWRRLELSSESEYVFDASNSSDSYFFTWSELSWSPRDWVHVGVAVQRTKVHQTAFDIQRGFLAGVSWKKATFTAYVFNPDEDPYVALGLTVDF